MRGSWLLFRSRAGEGQDTKFSELYDAGVAEW